MRPDKAFDWHNIVAFPAGVKPESSQIINWYSRIEHYLKSEEATLFVKKYLNTAVPLDIDAEVLKFASDQVTVNGEFLEMGVCTGRTINFIAALNPKKKIYGFDSFEGLPEKWERPDVVIPKGTFAIKYKNFIPSVLRNVELIKGLFENTLPIFKKNILQHKPIAFLHIDCDLYSSTSSVFANLGNNIVDGTIILFDELYNYPGYQEHEFKAFNEFLVSHNRQAKYLAFNQYVGQVVVKILGA